MELPHEVCHFELTTNSVWDGSGKTRSAWRNHWVNPLMFFSKKHGKTFCGEYLQDLGASLNETHFGSKLVVEPKFS